MSESTLTPAACKRATPPRPRVRNAAPPSMTTVRLPSRIAAAAASSAAASGARGEAAAIGEASFGASFQAQSFGMTSVALPLGWVFAAAMASATSRPTDSAVSDLRYQPDTGRASDSMSLAKGGSKSTCHVG